ncbi:hypothetical protein [Leptolyngbya sp. FACHB-261]|uniref:hypothetical protein n=1 Tax=Leptolyngbya sp. FACHB-261 TaxID=2692806 RepID=UPI001685B7F6|nr:hypothetical protein [Leptolyngbya sp. FACHB-261]MBD2100911.1 hypothetical protein [Leptolyngbya sp. FACHB-261]
MSQLQTPLQPKLDPVESLRLISELLTAEFAPEQIRVRSRLVQGWLQILCESEAGPESGLVLPRIGAVLRAQALPGAVGVAIYGQQHGEPQPLWQRRFRLPSARATSEPVRPLDVIEIEWLLQTKLEPLGLQVALQQQGQQLQLLCVSAQPFPREALVEPLLQTLRVAYRPDLQSALIGHRVLGEAVPSWRLKLDVRLPSVLAEELAHWGDLRALTSLVNRALRPLGMRANLVLLNASLHLSCEAVSGPVCSQVQVMTVLTPLLTQLDPQGIERVVIYGRSAESEQPLWVDCLSLPTASPAPLELARQGDLAALTVLINQALNPRLSVQLSLQGIRATLQQQLPLLHVVCESVGKVPSRSLTQRVADFVEELKLPGITGIRLYGRALGQARASWSWGRDFVQVSAETAADPAAPEAAIEDWVRSSDQPVGGLDWQDLAEVGSELKAQLHQRSLPLLQRWLSWLLVPTDPALERQTPQRSLKLAGLALALGLVATFALDQNLRQQVAEPPPASPNPLPNLSDLPPASDLNNPQLNAKLALFRHQQATGKQSPDVLIVGSSRALRGVDPSALEQGLARNGYPQVEVFNFGVNGATAKVVELLITRLLPSEQLPKLIIFADGARAFNSGRRDSTFEAIQQSPGYAELLAEPAPTSTTAQSAQSTGSPTPQQPDPRDQIKTGLVQLYSQWTADLAISAEPEDSSKVLAFPSLGDIDPKGFLPWSGRFNPTTYFQNYARVSGRYDGDYENFNLQGEQTQALQSLARFSRQNNIRLVVVNTPLDAVYLDEARTTYEQQFRSSMTQLARAEGFLFRDLSLLWPGRHDYFSDPSHLNRYGAAAVSEALVTDPLISWPQGAASQPAPTP